jgi:hypothetical protein
VTRRHNISVEEEGSADDHEPVDIVATLLGCELSAECRRHIYNTLVSSMIEGWTPIRESVAQPRRLYDYLRPIVPGHGMCPLLAVWGPIWRLIAAPKQCFDDCRAVVHGPCVGLEDECRFIAQVVRSRWRYRCGRLVR